MRGGKRTEEKKEKTGIEEEKGGIGREDMYNNSICINNSIRYNNI